jgi:transposase
MKAIPILGIDIAKFKFDVCLRTPDDKRHTATFANAPKGFRSLLSWLTKHKAHCVHACMEATSRYGDALALFLFEHQHRVSVVNARRTRQYADSRLVRTQNDEVDAGLIADFCAKENPRLWQPAPESKRRLLDLVRLRDFFVNQKQQCKNRMESEAAGTIDYLRKQISKLETTIKRIEKEIEALLKTNPAVENTVRLLRTIPGIGLITATTALAELPPVDQIEHVGAAVAFAGLDPKKKVSGHSISTTPRLSKMGPPLLRKTLYMAALCAIRTNPIIQRQAQRLAARGKTGKLALGAAMRKLLRLIYGIMKTQTPFDANWKNVDRAVYSSRRTSDGDELASSQLASPSVATA